MAIPDDEWNLPVAVSAGGETLTLSSAAKMLTTLSPSEKGVHALAAKFTTLDPKQRERLVIARLRSRGDLRIAALGGKALEVEEAVAQVQEQSPLGRKLMKIELALVERFVTEALSNSGEEHSGGAKSDIEAEEH
jgi:hypothetical protein